MDITIKNPAKGINGNKPENIFHAFDEDGKFLGFGYVYAEFNYQLSYEHPLNIYMDYNVDSNMPDAGKIKDLLFESLFCRAKEIRNEYKDIKARIYGGCLADNKEKLEYLVSKGLIHDEGSYLYEKILTADDLQYTRNSEIEIKQSKLITDSEKEAYLKLYNGIFIQKLDFDSLTELMNIDMWNNYTAYYDNVAVGSIMVYAKEYNESKTGYIENLYVLDEWKNKGIARQLMYAAFEYFINSGLKKTQLEVWSTNKRAVKLYESLGYRIVKETELYPGVCL